MKYRCSERVTSAMLLVLLAVASLSSAQVFVVNQDTWSDDMKPPVDEVLDVIRHVVPEQNVTTTAAPERGTRDWGFPEDENMPAYVDDDTFNDWTDVSDSHSSNIADTLLHLTSLYDIPINESVIAQLTSSVQSAIAVIRTLTHDVHTNEQLYHQLRAMLPFAGVGRSDGQRLENAGMNKLRGGDLKRKMAAGLANISRECVDGALALVQNLFLHQGSFWRFLDSYGKLPSGVAEGDLKWVGSYDQCRNATWRAVMPPSNRTYTGQHCLTMLGNEDAINPGAGMLPTLGICVPDTCNEHDITSVLAPVTTILLKSNVTVHCNIKPDPTTSYYVWYVWAAIVLLLLIVGSMVDVFGMFVSHHRRNKPSALHDRHEEYHEAATSGEHDDDDDDLLIDSDHQEVQVDSVNVQQPQASEGVLKQLMLSFSVFINGSKILATSNSRGSESFLASLNGMRVISMWWVVFGHSISFSATFMRNPVVILDLFKRFSFQVLLVGTLSVDSFFFLSGLLVSYLTLKQLDTKNGSINWVMFYFHRFWRLTPLYMFCLVFFMGVYMYLLDGPFQAVFHDNPALNSCDKYWWTNLIYINNFIPSKMSDMCMGWSWYLANDMQFFLISPLFIYLLYRWRYIGYAALLVMFAFTLSFTAGMASKHHLNPIMLLNPPPSNLTRDEQLADAQFSSNIYIRPYYRISPYLVGIAMGYIFYRTRGNTRMHWVFAVLGWCVSTVFGMLLIYGFYPWYKHDKPLPHGTSVLYQACGRAAWAMVLSWIVFACGHGFGGPVNKFLSWRAWSPLSRLTYAVYLVHPMVMVAYFIQRRDPTTYTDINAAYDFIGNLVISYGFAFIVSLAVESPMMALEKVIFRRWR